MKIRESHSPERAQILEIHTMAFGPDKGQEIAELVDDMFEDPSAVPLLSLVAVRDDELAGHVLFTKVDLAGSPTPVSASLLAPLAVLPQAQGRGVGGALIREGLSRLKRAGGDLVFVLGHPSYYPRSGFTPAGVLDYKAPYAIPEEHAGAWMVIELSAGAIARSSGRVECCDVLNQPQHWRE